MLQKSTGMMDPDIAFKLAMDSNLEAKDVTMSDKKKLAKLKKKASKSVVDTDKNEEYAQSSSKVVLSNPNNQGTAEIFKD